MSEEIIIDGVNVAECGVYKDNHCKDKTSIMFCDANLCSNYPYCYYKQLKRLQAENERLKRKKEIASEVAKDNSIFEDWYYELKEKNKELKQENIGMKKSFVDIIDNIREENYRYYKALKEADALFEVLENIMPSITLPEGNASPRAIKEARELINEVLDERN